MDFKDNRNLAIGVLLCLVTFLLTSTAFLFYKSIIAVELNHDLDRENTLLYRDKQELIKKLEAKGKQEATQWLPT